MVKMKSKKRRVVKKSENNKVEKDLKKKKKSKVEKALALVTKKEIQTTDSDSDDSQVPESDRLQKLLEPYAKEQLIDFIVDAAVKDASLFDRIRDAADGDVSHRKIFVHGLGWDTTRETLTSVFEPFGEIEECNVVTDRATGKAKGFGFVLFKSRRGAAKALKEPRKKISNRIASCQLASVGSVPPPQGYDNSGRKIYVSNVQADVDPERLRQFFEKFGPVETGPIGFDMQSGRSRGFALFVYKTHEGAKKVLEEPYKIFDGHQLNCQWAADGKNKVTASVTTAIQPVQAPVLAAVAAAQNMALFSQHPSLNPMYGAMLANPNAAFLAAGGFGSSQMGQVGGAGGSFGGVGGYGGAASLGLGGNQSVLGTYGGSLQGLQHVYQPSSQMGQSSTTRAAGSFSGYPSY